MFNQIGIKLNTLFKFNKFYYGRQNQHFVPIYPNDKVIVLPPWDKNKLNGYRMRILSKNENYEEQNKIITGTVLEMRRKKGLAVVTNTPMRQKYKSVESFYEKYEEEGIENIKPTMEYIPIPINRIRLRDLDQPGTLKTIKAEMVRDENGRLMRVKKGTNEEIPWTPKSKVTYEERNANKPEGPKDTPAQYVQLKTYNGINFQSIAREFLNKIKEKEKIEENLILRDK